MNSAGGSASEARDTVTQSIYRLRGKPLNTHDRERHQITANKEFFDIIEILGTGIGKNFDISKLTHDKICVLSDSDVDGLHIQCLLLTFFWKHTPELIKQGKVYIGQPPLYRVKEGTKAVYIKDAVEYSKYITKRISKIFEIVTVDPISKEKKKLSPADMVKLLLATKFYQHDIKNIASQTATSPKLLEQLLIYSAYKFDSIKKVIDKQFNEINTKVLGDVLSIEGVIDNEYQSINVDKELINELKSIGVEGFSNKMYAVKNVEKGETGFKLMSLSDMLTLVTKAAEPKTIQRFKGLGRYIAPCNRNVTSKLS